MVQTILVLDAMARPPRVRRLRWLLNTCPLPLVWLQGHDRLTGKPVLMKDLTCHCGALAIPGELVCFIHTAQYLSTPPPSMNPDHPDHDPKLTMIQAHSLEEEMVDIIFALAEPIQTNISMHAIQVRAIKLVNEMQKRGRFGKGPPRET